jgi:hypothetical protein
LVLLLLPLAVHAAAPDLRDQVSLNGTWDFTPSGQAKSTIPVPEAWDASTPGGPGFSCNEGVYERQVTMPGSWTGQIIKAELEAVNYLADVYVNDVLAGTHVGGWIPFSVDITDQLGTETNFILKVAVKGGSFQPIVDGSGKPLWPVGWYGHEQQWGIIADTWLRAYGKVHVDDAFIQTSVRNDELRVDYVVTNTLSHSATVTVSAVVFDAATGSITQKTVSAQSVTLGAGEAKAVTLTETWTNPTLWTPDAPHLYHLRTTLVDEGTGEPIDTETRRFGFREIWIENNQYILNGTRINLFGTSMVDHCQGYDTLNYLNTAPGKVSGLVDKLKRMNVNIIRFHQAPVQRWIADKFDELGMFMINESAIYARDYMLGDKATYLSNCSTWIEPWIKGYRNHPSIILWSAENEMGRGWLNWMTDSEILALGNRIREFDTTRPVIYDGDKDVGDVTFNYHYPEGYSAKYTGSIYKWSTLVRANETTSIGEFLTHYGGNGEENQWWHGLIVRGLRYLDFNDVRPYTFDWVVADTNFGLTAKEINLRNGLAPVALFDKDYDDLGLTVIRDLNYPSVDEGSTVNRTLVLYNDEFRDTNVSVKVLITSGGVTNATGQGVVGLALGYHKELPISFQAPYNGGTNMEMVLQTRKDGVLRFEEARVFKLTETGASGSYSNTVTITGVMPGDADNDGMPDEWENTYLGSTNANPLADTDGDGALNIDEYSAGTHPSNALSAFVLKASPIATDDQIIITWSSVTGKFYRVKATDDLRVGFTNTLKTSIEAVPPSNVYTDDTMGSHHRYYRIALE